MIYVQGSYNRVSDLKMERLTEQQILDTINNKNVSQIFLKDFNFKDLLGDIRYNSRGEVVGAGAVEMKFYTTGTTQAKKYLAMVLKIFVTVNITDVRLHGTAARGEKIDQEAFEFEGKKKYYRKSRLTILHLLF